MIRWIAAPLMFALPMSARADAPPDEGSSRFAVIVGVSDYEDPRIPDVPNAAADARAVRDWLTTVGGVPVDHTVVLLDDGAATLSAAAPGEPIVATRSNVLEATDHWLGARAERGDTVFVYFSGQGTADGGAPVLLPRDARDPLAADTGLDLRHLGASLTRLGVVPVVWLDTSFGGRGTGYGEGLSADAWIGAPDRVLWMAAPPDRVAEEARDVPHGAFTHSLLRALRAADGRVSRTELQLVQSAPVRPLVDRTVGDRFPIAAVGTEAAQRPEVVPQSGHGDAVTALAWHPARPWLASADATGMVQITDVDDQQIRLRLPSGRRGVFRLAFSPDGGRLYVAGRDGVLRAWDPTDGELQWEHAVSKIDQLRSLTVRDDVVAVGTSRARVVVVDAVTGARRARFRIGDSPGRLRPAVAAALAWTDDGRQLVSGGDNGELSAWWRGRGLSRWSHQRPLLGPGPAIRDLDLVGEHVAVGLATGEVRLVRLDDGTTDAILPSTGYAVRRLDAAGRIAVAADDIRVWEPAGDVERSLSTPSPTSTLAWSPQQTLVSGHDDGSLVLWDVDAGQPAGRLPGQAAGVRRLAVRDGMLLVAGEAGATLWSLDEGQLVQRLRTDAEHEGISALALAPGGDQVIGGSDAGVLYAWDARTGAVRQRWPLEAPIRDVSLSEDEVLAATDGFVERITADDRLRWATRAHEPVRSARPCGGDLVLHTDRGFRRLDRETGERQGRRHHGGRIVACSPDGARLAVGRESGRVDLYDAATLQRTGQLDRLGGLGDVASTVLGDHQVTDIAWHPTEPRLAASRIGATARVWDLDRGGDPLELDAFGTTAIAFAPGRLVVTGSSDGLVQFWDLDSGALVASLVSLGGDWLAWTPDGLFDGSLDGQRTLFRWRIGETLHPPSRFHRGFYEPGLLGAIAQGRRPRAERDIASLQPPPKVTITSPEAGAKLAEGTVTVEIAVADQGGGASDPRLYVNGHRITAAGGRGLALQRDQGGERVRFRVELAEGRNYLRATAYNGDGNWEALGDERVVEWTAPPTEAPKLHVLAVGIDKYRNARLNLDLARDDADAIGRFFEPGLFGEVVHHVLLDERASLGDIRAAFERIAAAAAPRDALLVYLAGHGVLEGEVFHFLPWDADVGSPDAIAATALSQTELGERLASVPAMKQLVVLDACHSGAASGALVSVVGRRASPGLVRAQTRLARSTGAFLIAASTDAQVAHEIPELGHGVLTYAILRGLGDDGPPEAHVDREGNVTVNTLIQYVSDLVPVLTDTYRQQRQEVVQAAEGQDFPLVAP